VSRIGPCDTSRKEMLPLQEMVWPKDNEVGRDQQCISKGFKGDYDPKKEGGTIDD